MEKYTALYSRFYAKETIEGNSKEELIEQLENIEDHGNGMAIAIIENGTNQMVWFKDFIGKEQCQKDVNDFLLSLEQH